MALVGTETNQSKPKNTKHIKELLLFHVLTYAYENGHVAITIQNIIVAWYIFGCQYQSCHDD